MIGKFRAWDEDMGHMYPAGETHIYLTSTGECRNFQNGVRLLPLFFTGLVDKKRTVEYPKGQEIYDGDVLRQFPGFGCEWSKRIGIVKYEYASFWIVFNKWSTVLDDHDCSFEVIGNIYSNPELKTT